MEPNLLTRTPNQELEPMSVKGLLDITSARTYLARGNDGKLFWASLNSLVETPVQDTLHLNLHGDCVTLPIDIPCLWAAEPGELFCKPTTPRRAVECNVLIPYVRFCEALPQTIDSIDTAFGHKPARPAVESQLYLDYQFGYVLGNAMCRHRIDTSEGFSVCIISTDLREHRLAFLVDSLRSFLLPNIHVELSKDSPAIRIESFQFYKHLCAWIGEKGSSYFPRFLFAAPDDFREGFLVGLLDSRCTKLSQQFNVEYSSTSYKLAILTRWLGACLNVDATIREQNRFFRVRFNSHDVLRFEQCFIADALADLRAEDDREMPFDTYDIVPISTPLADAIYSHIPSKDTSLKTTFHNAKRRGRVSRKAAVKAIGLYGAWMDSLPFGSTWVGIVNDRDIGWTWIKRCDDGSPNSLVAPTVPDGCSTWVTETGLILAAVPGVPG